MDPSPAQIDHARAGVLGPCVDFHVSDAENLPFEDAFFDVAASALVLNFIPDRARALAEMRRVVRPGGCIAAYVWDFTGPLSVNRHVADVLRAIKADVAPIPGVKSTRMEALHEIFEAAGLADVAGRAIEVERRFADFEAYWRGFLDNPTPASGFIRQLPKDGYEEFREAVRSSLSEAPDGSVTFAARAHAIKAIKPR
jgi:ubiquinone/menaquinone biosynthesis C-methylase UbiE